MFFLLNNSTSFVIIARFRDEILPLGGGRVRKEMCQILGGFTTQTALEETPHRDYSAKSIGYPR